MTVPTVEERRHAIRTALKRLLPTNTYATERHTLVTMIEEMDRAGVLSGIALPWRCFHCEDVFTDPVAAAAHFGTGEQHQAGCIEKLSAPEKNLVLALRKVCDEFHALQFRVSEEITNDEYFYGRLRRSLATIPKFKDCISLHDVFNLFDSLEGRVLAAEERLARLQGSNER